MAHPPEEPRDPSKDPARRRSMLGVVAYLLVPGERRRRASGHFGRAAMETARGVRALSRPSDRSGQATQASGQRQNDRAGETGAGGGDRQRIRID